MLLHKVSYPKELLASVSSRMMIFTVSVLLISVRRLVKLLSSGEGEEKPESRVSLHDDDANDEDDEDSSAMDCSDDCCRRN